MVKKPLGFGDIRQTAEFFGLSVRDVTQRVTSGEWQSYVIAGRRVFDLDQLVESLAKDRTPQEVPAQ